jgi:ABC-type multidrug transport system ATPase subunit
MITIQNLNKIYPGGCHAINDISFTFDAGVYGLLGPNGAGKTTLIRLLVGLLRPTSGKIEIDGLNLATPEGQEHARRVLGYLPQELGLHGILTVEQELDYFALLKGIRSEVARRKEVANLLEQVGLVEQHRLRIKDLSGGQKRRLGIAVSLIGQPHLLIVDEPTAGLDPAERVRFRNLLSELGAEGRVVILSTHIVDDIAQTCRELVVIQSGSILFQGSVSTLTKYAQRQVWVTTNAYEIAGLDPSQLVSSCQKEDGTETRFLGQSTPLARSVQPTLEDAYLLLINDLLRPDF